MQLRDYQQSGINEIRNCFKSGIRRVCYVAPCGAGKGTMVAWMASKAASRGNRVLFIIHRRELLQQIADDIQIKHSNIQLASVQSIVRKLPSIKKPDLIISDEFHHGTAQTWRRIFDFFSGAYLVGLTATPARANGQGLSDICDKLIFGPNVQELINRGFLAPYKYYAPHIPIDLSQIKIKMGDYDQSELTLAVDRPHITGQVLDHYKNLADGKQAIVYCTSIQHSKNTVDIFRDAGIKAAHVDGETSDSERKQAIADFKAGRLTVLSNVQLFGEGLNVPGVEVVILLRPTQSLVLHTQQSMRSMRPGQNKTAIIIDAAGNCFRHGLPTDEHEWTLDSKPKRRKIEQTEVKIKVCEFCYSAFKPAPVCPICGAEQPTRQAEVKQEEGELHEITAIERKHRRMEVGMARTLDDLRRIAKERNYNPSWVYIQAKIKHITR